MPVEIVVPRLSWSMDEGVFTGWLKSDGAVVATGEPLFALESDKAMQEVESLDGGVLRIAPDGPAPGATVAVGRVIGYLVQAGESTPVRPVRAAPPLASPDQPRARVPVEAARSVGALRATPRARRLARMMGVELTRVRGSGRDGRIRERDVVAAAKP